jgi:hypothetical protein
VLKETRAYRKIHGAAAMDEVDHGRASQACEIRLDPRTSKQRETEKPRGMDRGKLGAAGLEKEEQEMAGVKGRAELDGHGEAVLDELKGSTPMAGRSGDMVELAGEHAL